MQIRSKVSPTSAVLAPSGQEKRDKGRQNPRRRRRSKRTIKRGEGGRECFLFLAAGDLCARNRIAPGNETTRTRKGNNAFARELSVIYVRNAASLSWKKEKEKGKEKLKIKRKLRY